MTSFFIYVSQTLFIFSQLFEFRMSLIIVISLNLLVNLVFDIFFQSSQVYCKLIISLCEIIVHLMFLIKYVDVSFQSVFSINLHSAKSVFLPYIFCISDFLMPKFVFAYFFLPLLTSEFRLFWSSYIFTNSHCSFLAFCFIEFWDTISPK